MNTKQHRTWLTLLAVTVLTFGLVGGRARAGSAGGTIFTDTGANGLAHTISVSGIGTATARPDVAYIILGVEIINEDVTEALTDSTTRMQAIREALDEFDLAPEDLQTVQYNVWVEQDRNERGEPSDTYRYHVVNQLRVRLHDIELVGPVLTAGLDAGANSVGGISFEVEDTTALEARARELAMANAKTKAEQLAEGFEATIVGLNQVAEVGSGPGPVVRAMPIMEEAGIGGGGQVPVEAGEYSVSVQLSVVFDIEAPNGAAASDAQANDA